jgi:hypothetical protein
MFVRRVLAVLALCLSALTFVAIPARADSVTIPFNDRNVLGSLTFCDKNDKEVTSGSITDIPFVWKYISSEPAPQGYYMPLGKAVAYVLQPREGVDPGLWNGKQMTGSARYSNPKHPVVQATYGDLPLMDFTSIAPLWQGLAQVRVYYTNINMQPYRKTYPAAIIKVDGTHWTLVKGGGGDCTAGKAVSGEVNMLGPSHLPTASPTFHGANPSVTPSAIVVGAPTPTTSTTPAAGASPTVSAGSQAPASDTGAGGNNVASSSGSSSGTSLPLILAAVIGLPLIGGLIGAYIVRRNTATAGAVTDSNSGSHSGS